MVLKLVQEVLIFLCILQITEGVEGWGTWEELTNIHLSSSTSSTNVLCSDFTNTFQSPTSGTSRIIVFNIDTEGGYSQIGYYLDLNLYSTSPSTPNVIFKENGFTVLSDSQLCQFSNTICSAQSYETKIHFITTKSQQYQLSDFSITISGQNYFVKNFKIFALRCTPNCAECLEGQCIACQSQFELNQGSQCVCPKNTPIFHSGHCIAECPSGYYLLNKQCTQYTSKLNIFQDTTLNQYHFIPDYNTTVRSKTKQTINGHQFAGPFIQNEKIQYQLNYKSPIKVDIQIKLQLFLLNFNTSSLLCSINIEINEYQVFQLTNFGASLLGPEGQFSNVNCVLQGFQVCNEINIQTSVQDIQELNSIKISGNLFLHDFNVAWALGSILIDEIVPTSAATICPNFIYQDNCVDTCPPYTNIVVKVCQDYFNVYKFPQYIERQYYNATSLFAIWTHDVKSSFYEKRFIMGGFGIWQNKQFTKQIAIGNAHYKLKLYVKILLIDFQQDDAITISFESKIKKINRSSDGVICFNPTGSNWGTVPCSQREQIGTSQNDFFYSLVMEITHTEMFANLRINCITSYTSYCAIYDLFLIEASCPYNCEVCNSDTECQKSQSNIEVYYDCPQGTYNDFKSCKMCSSGCISCLNNYICNVCSDQHDLFGAKCFCKCSHYQQDPCLCDCLPNCKVCLNGLYLSSKQEQPCLVCDTQNHQVLNGIQCICEDGYFFDGSYKCQPCYPTCSKCLSSLTCTGCFTQLNRTLKDSQCQCQQGYYGTDELLECFTCNTLCKECQYQGDFCTHCYSSQFRVLYKNKCVCQKGYYENGDDICMKCSETCEYCSSFDYCLTCNDIQFRQLDKSSCICQNGYYDNGESICQACHFSCNQCNNSNAINQCTQCPKSRIQTSNKLKTFMCTCKKGYYEENYTECISCKTFTNPPVAHYCYSYCGDKITQWNEDCDDGNDNPRDGCDLCKFSDNLCSSTICEECQYNQCIQCIDGYYMNSENQCIECSHICQTCSDASDNCVSCKYQYNNTCINCSSQFGFVELENQCFSICGDGIKTYEEGCDDGNTLSGDGCNENCQIEVDYICEQQLCYKIPYLELYLKESNQDSKYNNVRRISLTLSEQIQTDSNITSLITIKPVQEGLEFLSIHIKESDNFDQDYSVNIDFQLNQTAVNPIAIIIIENYTLIMNNNNYPLKYGNYTINLLDYYEQSTTVISTTQSAMQLSTIILYILLALFVVSFILGGTEIFWNLLDTIQLLSYLKYFNVTYPYNLQQYFTIFGFAEFGIFKQYFDIEQYIETPNAAEKFYQEGYSTVFLVNVISVIVVFITTLLTFVAFHLLYYLIARIIHKYESDELGVITFLQIARKIQSFFFNQKIQLKCGLLRAFMAISFDLNLAIFLQLNDFKVDNKDLFISSLCATFSLAVQFYVIYTFWIELNRPRYQMIQNQYQLNYGALYEGLVLKDQYSRYYNLVIILKKSLQMGSLVVLYYYPCFQITAVLLLESSILIYLYLVKPLENKTEFYKQIITEMLLSSIQFLIIFYAYNEINTLLNEEMITIIGWIIIGQANIIILVQLLFDIKEQILFLQGKYKLMQFLLKQYHRIKRSLLKNEDDTIESEQSEPQIKQIQQQPHIGQQIKTRKLIAFSLPIIQESSE